MKEILVIDLETTGLDYWYHSIVEIGMCLLDIENKEIIPLLNIICKESDKYISKYSWIFYNSSLTYEEVIAAPELEKYRKKIQALLNKYPCTAYNQEFDFTFLEDRGFKIPKKIFDPMLELTPIMKLYHEFYGWKYPSVEEAYHYFFKDNGFKTAHRALDDTIIEAKIICKLLELKKSEDE